MFCYVNTSMIPRMSKFAKVNATFCFILIINGIIFHLSENAKNSDIPHSYLLITNNEVVRVRYLLIYCTKKAAGRTSTTRVDKVATAPRIGFLTWCRRNPLLVSAFLYIFLLFLVGISKSRFVHFYTTSIMKFLSDRLKFV